MIIGFARALSARKVIAAAGSYGLTGTAANVKAGFGPADLTGLIGWWDARVTASITLAGSAVSAMADQSGAGNNIVSGSGVGAPTYSATGFNGRPGITQAGSAKYGLFNAAFPLGTGNTITIFGVFLFSSASGDYARLVSYTQPGASHDYSTNGSFLVFRENNTSGLSFARNTVFTTLAYGYATPRRVIVTVKSDGTTTLYVDGVPQATSPLVANWVTGGWLGIGVSQFDTTTFNQLDGAWGESGIATGYTSPTDAARLDTYLKNSWGL